MRRRLSCPNVAHELIRHSAKQRHKGLIGDHIEKRRSRKEWNKSQGARGRIAWLSELDR